MLLVTSNLNTASSAAAIPSEHALKTQFEENRLRYCSQLRLDCSVIPTAQRMLSVVRNSDYPKLFEALQSVTAGLESAADEPGKVFLSHGLVNLQGATDYASLPTSAGSCVRTNFLSSLDRAIALGESPAVETIRTKFENFLNKNEINSEILKINFQIFTKISNLLNLSTLSTSIKTDLNRAVDLITSAPVNSLSDRTHLMNQFLIPLVSELGIITSSPCYIPYASTNRIAALVRDFGSGSGWFGSNRLNLFSGRCC